MNIFEIIGYLVAGFILFSLATTILAWIRSKGLSSEARAQFIHWRTLHNNAFADGDHTSAKLYKAKELLVYTTNYPIVTHSLSAPLLCNEGQLEQKSEDELDELIVELQSMSKAERAELIRQRNESNKRHGVR